MRRTTRDSLIVCLIAVVGALGVFILMTGMFGLEFRVLSNIALGWISFLRRTLPQVQPNLSGIGTAALCSAILIPGLSMFLNQLLSGPSLGGNGGVSRSRWRWSLAVLCGFWLVFVLSMAASGLFRQVTWLPSFKESWLVPRYQGYQDLKSAALDIRIQLMDAPTAPGDVQTAFRDRLSAYLGTGSGWERIHFLTFQRSVGSPVQVLLFHRDPTLRAKFGFVFVQGAGGNSEEFLPIRQLPEMIAKLNGELATNSISQ